MQPSSSLHPLSLNDVETLASLHANCFETGWTAASFLEALQIPGTFGFSVESKAFILCRVAADECEILTLAVLPEARRQGFGGELVGAACGEAAVRKCGAMFLEVGVENLPARRLYERLNFWENGVRENYYPHAEGREDALLMRRELTGNFKKSSG